VTVDRDGALRSYPWTSVLPLCVDQKAGNGSLVRRTATTALELYPKCCTMYTSKRATLDPCWSILPRYNTLIYINQKLGSLVVVSEPQPVTQRTSMLRGRGSAAGYGRMARTACADGLAGPVVAVARDEVCPSQHGRVSRNSPRAANGQNKLTSLKYAS